MKELKQIRIKNPCPESWDSMSGDGRSRFCERCETRVVNISTMSPLEVDSLAADNDGGLCVRYRAKPDGTPVLRSERADRSPV